MLPLELFRRRNFAVGNAQTFVMYCGFGVVFFFVVLFLQQVAGYSALQAGLAVLPASVIMFVFSKRVGRLADRFGAHLFIGLGPLVAAAGVLLLTKLQVPFNYASNLLPGWVLLSCGLTATFAPLTAAGTLDPMATGVLAVALGEATKTVPYAMDAEKTYRFTATWGEARDSDDAEGAVTGTSRPASHRAPKSKRPSLRWSG